MFDISKIKIGAKVQLTGTVENIIRTDDGVSDLFVRYDHESSAWVSPESQAIVSFENPVEEPKVGEVWQPLINNNQHRILNITGRWVTTQSVIRDRMPISRSMSVFKRDWRKVPE